MKINTYEARSHTIVIRSIYSKFFYEKWAKGTMPIAPLLKIYRNL
ncbi:hypothetical protein [Kamptonema sp. UHCC 0994]|nr:hypothetical protein [Kamptonema sp. UHCC 0994]MDF0552245.1 hypothetical protein [Kamptonema sp. UHCC 0994]